MRRITDVPNISKEMKALYDKFWETGDFNKIQPHIDAFLEKYPYYIEAIIFKARSLMALSRNNEALRYIKLAKRIDIKHLLGSFDEAEIHLIKNNGAEAIRIYVEAVADYAIELQNGIDSYLSNCSKEHRELIQNATNQALAEHFSKNCETDPFAKLHSILSPIGETIAER